MILPTALKCRPNRMVRKAVTVMHTEEERELYEQHLENLRGRLSVAQARRAQWDARRENGEGDAWEVSQQIASAETDVRLLTNEVAAIEARLAQSEPDS